MQIKHPLDQKLTYLPLVDSHPEVGSFYDL